MQAYLYLVTTFLQNFLSAGQDGLRLIATAVLPVLFPFFVLTTLILNLTKSTKPWLVTLLSYLSGYPNGARLTQSLYLQNRLNLQQAQQLSIITSTPSPIFVIATAGVVLLRNLKLGCIIFICSIFGALINGWLWKPRQTNLLKQNHLPLKPNATASTHFFQNLSNALTSSTNAIINVCGVILFFYICARLIKLPPILAGLLEMTTGVAVTTNPYLVQFFVTFGGFSVAMQQQVFLQSFKVKFSSYLAYKITHGILACGLLALYLLFLN